jgi:glutamine amidotransferase PdxT
MGHYDNLQNLLLSHNCVISSIGNVENLSVLYINGGESNVILPLFPLENLKELTSIRFDSTEALLMNCHRLHNLLSLFVENDRCKPSLVFHFLC